MNLWYLSSSQLTVGSSILLMRTMRFLTPAVLTSIACSRVWPPRSKPVSNSPLRAEITWKESVVCFNIMKSMWNLETFSTTFTQCPNTQHYCKRCSKWCYLTKYAECTMPQSGIKILFQGHLINLPPCQNTLPNLTFTFLSSTSS